MLVLLDLGSHRFACMQSPYLQLEDLKIDLKGSGVSITSIDKTTKPNKRNIFQDDPLNIQRRQKVKDSMLHAWTSYEKYAWGHDELQVR